MSFKFYYYFVMVNDFGIDLNSIKNPVAREMVEKSLKEMNQPLSPKQQSRNWQDPEGYRYLFPWSNAVLLRYFVRLFTESLPPKEFRRKTQLDDAGRSVVRNIEEGFKRATTKEYLEFIGFSQGSLEEVKGDTREMSEDGFLKSKKGSGLKDLGIDLKEFNFSLRRKRQFRGDFKGELEENDKEPSNLSFNPSSNVSPNSSFNVSSNYSSNNPLSSPNPEFSYQDIRDLYPPLKKIKAEDLTYEIFMELVNKTDYLLRQLVVSLENKLNNDKKYYQVEQIRLNRRSKGG